MFALRQALKHSRGLQHFTLGRSILPAVPLLLGNLDFSREACRELTSSPQCSSPVHIEDELYCRQRQLVVLGNRVPVLAPDTWVAPNAVLIGDVDLFDKVRNMITHAHSLPHQLDCSG
jgi:hypothetical protein